ncbi:MAG: hypothetical protein GXP27_13430 [Planctomycetes bacterium]|nr:hypothetical protein [Planctomycetota bacterium]
MEKTEKFWRAGVVLIVFVWWLPAWCAASASMPKTKKPQAHNKQVVNQAASRKPAPKTARAGRIDAAFQFESRFAELMIDRLGRCVALRSKTDGTNWLSERRPLVTVTVAGRERAPKSVERFGAVLKFHFEQPSVIVNLLVRERRDYWLFRPLEVSGGAKIEKLSFATFRLRRGKYQSRSAGLVADERFGVCLRALTPQTRFLFGGDPPWVGAYVESRWPWDRAAAALAAAPADRLRSVLQEVIEKEEEAVSPLGGPFALDVERTRGSYLFSHASPKSVSTWIDLALRSGCSTLHLGAWYDVNGDYEPRSDWFPRGLDDMKQVCEEIHRAGLSVGIHTHTGCIDPRSSFASPVPDRRLATDAEFTLAADIDEQAATVQTVEPPHDFDTVWLRWSGRGNCIRIDDELILFHALSREKAPFGFLKCQRGAFGTRPAPHRKGAKVYHMATQIGSFLARDDSSLISEVAERIARVANACRVDQIYLDSAGTAESRYGVARTHREIYYRLAQPTLIESSFWTHHLWPMLSRIGAHDVPLWGFEHFVDWHVRRAQTYQRSYLLPAQLGWWTIHRPNRYINAMKLDATAYLCARALAYDMPISVVGLRTSDDVHEHALRHLTLIGQYERLRLACYFDETTLERLKPLGRHFRLGRDRAGRWSLRPVEFTRRRVEVRGGRADTWSVQNRFAAQSVKLRIESLHTAASYESSDRVVLADATDDRRLSLSGTADGVTARGEVVADSSRRHGRCLQITARNERANSKAAWCRFSRTFEPRLDIGPCDAVGFWVYGDGKGELLNVQLTSEPPHMVAHADLLVRIDFVGWRYFERHLRERDADQYSDKWPYGDAYSVYRNVVPRNAVAALNVYLNDLPIGETVTCRLGPIVALPVRKTVLKNPAVQINSHAITFPVELRSGMWLEFESPDDCRLYDEHGRLTAWVRPEGDVPELRPGKNRVGFSCDPAAFEPIRAAVTVITTGEPFGRHRAVQEINFSHLARQYEPPRTVLRLDGHQNVWPVWCQPELGSARLAIDLYVEQADQAGRSPGRSPKNGKPVKSAAKSESRGSNELVEPEFAVDGTTVRIPVRLHPRDRLRLQADGTCWLIRDGGKRRLDVTVSPIRLSPGRHQFRFGFAGGPRDGFRVLVSIVELYELD